MTLLNASLDPHLYAHVRQEYLHNLESGHGQTLECVIFGVCSQGGRALSFHILTKDGACFWRVPLHALCMRPGAPVRPLWQLQRWDCFGELLAVTVFDYLVGARARCFLPDKAGELHAEGGSYLFTVDWFGNGFSDEPSQHKSAHVIALDDGNLAAQPNNRCQFLDASFVQPFTERPRYRTNTHAFSAEQQQLRSVEDGGAYFYQEKAG